MDMYEIDYIDGYTMKYSVFNCAAGSKEEAIAKLKESQWGDFDNRYLCIYRNQVMVWEE